LLKRYKWSFISRYRQKEYVYMFENENEPSLTAIQWFNKGYDYDVKEEYDNAIFAYTKAIELNPQDGDAYTNRGAVYDTKGEYDLAITDYTKGIELNPQDGDAYTNRGNVYLGKGQYDLAISDYDKMIELNPRDVDVYINKVFACEQSGLYTSSQIDAVKQKIRDLGGQI